MKCSAASSWFLRAIGGFRRQLLREMLSAQKAGQALREMQLKQLQESHWNKERRAATSYTEPRHHIPNAFRCISLTDSTAFYTKCNSSGRPYQVWRHEARHPHDTLLFEEKDPSCTVDVTLTRDRNYITINSNTRTSSEVRILTPHHLTEPPLLLRPRQHRVEYYVDHAHKQFYIFTNLAADQEFKVMTAENSTPHNWKDYYKPKNGFRLQDMELFDWCTVLYGMKDNVPVVMVISADQHDEEPLLLYHEDVCHIEKSGTHEFHSKTLTFWASSPAKPPTLHVCSGKKMTTVSNSEDQLPFSDYCTERVAAVSRDGTRVPMTLCYHRGLLKRDGSNPVLVHVYGCYGENLYMGYQPGKLPLLSRGWVLAYCHVRGGGELGRRWYYHGQGREKHNTFEDLHACVDYLHMEAYSQPRLTALHGRSAGGMAVGMFCNLWPHLAQAAILQVPFVNVIDSLSDSSLYLTAKDYIEFGNPHASEGDLQHILSICPYSSLRPQVKPDVAQFYTACLQWLGNETSYPAVLVLASKQDSIIPFEGVQKYVSKLKLCVQQHWSNTGQELSTKQTWMSLLSTNTNVFTESPIPRGTVLFHINKHHNHHGSGEYTQTLKEVVNLLPYEMVRIIATVKNLAT